MHVGRLRKLKYLTFMAGASTIDATRQTIDDERAVVKEWGKSCPSLRTIILPKGQMWIWQKDGDWVCTDHHCERCSQEQGTQTD